MLVSCFNVVPVFAQGRPGGSSEKKETVALRIRTSSIDETLGEKKAASLDDTLSLNFQNMAFPEKKNTVAASHLGNIGSPFQSKIYTDRKAKHRFLFLQPYSQWKTSMDEWLFFNTTRPYTNAHYITTVGNDYSQEEDFRFFFTVNADKYLNFGAEYRSTSARGYYSNTATRSKIARLFGNYQSPRYEAFMRATYNRFENYENGGITDDRYITHPLEMSGGYREYESLNIPVHLSNTFNLATCRDVFYNHKYNIGFKRQEVTEDDTVEVFVPVTAFIHTFHLDNGWKKYDSRTANPAFYDTAYIDNTHTADTAALTTVRNTFGLSLREGFHSWVKFGLTAYAEHEYRQYARISSAAIPDSSESDPFKQMVYHRENLVWLGGRLASTGDSALRFNVDAKICMLGSDYAGNFEIKGDVSSRFRLWGRPVYLAADGFVVSRMPDYFLRRYYSNHFDWNNAFRNEYKTRISGSLSIPALGFDLSAGVENISNYVYFDRKALPAQYDGQIQVLFAAWKQHLGYGIINLDNEAVFQLSGKEEILPLPRLSLYTNLYAKTKLFDVLTLQAGVDCRYHTAYYVPKYMPATGQFYLQDELKIGNYPFMNAYANFHLKRARFFVMYTHGSRWFADPNYFSLPHYPLNPAGIKAGLSWNFYD